MSGSPGKHAAGGDGDRPRLLPGAVFQGWEPRKQDLTITMGTAWLLLLAVAAGIAGAAFWKLLEVDGCPSIHLDLQLAGDVDRVRAVLERCNAPRGAIRDSLLLDLAFPLAYVSLGFAVFTLLGRARRGLRRDAPRIGAWKYGVVAAGILDWIENGFLLLLLPAGGDLGQAWIAVGATTAAWLKWAALAGFALVVFVDVGLTLAAMVDRVGYAAARWWAARRDRDTEQPASPATFEGDDGGFGICASGGGIRSASFTLGALEVLDAHGLFRRARWLTAVSGGSYTAGAWRIARGVADDPGELPPAPTVEPAAPDGGTWIDCLFGDRGEATPNHHAYWRANRRFLDSGVGGVLATGIIGVVFIALNVVLLALLVWLVAQPIGWFFSSWAVQPELRGASKVLDLPIPKRLWMPGAVLGAAALVPLLSAVGSWRSARRRWLKVAGALTGGGLVLFGALAAVPWLLVEIPDHLEPIEIGAAIAGGGLVGAILRVVAEPATKLAPRLGGVLLALVVLLFGATVVRNAYAAPADQLSDYLLLVLAFVAVYLLGNQRVWSLHTPYRWRLRTTFSTTVDRTRRTGLWRSEGSSTGVWPLSAKVERAERTWDRYPTYRPPTADDPGSGPELIVCAAIQRQGVDVSGVPAVSFVFSAREIGWYEAGPDGEAHLVHPAAFAEALPGWWRRGSRAQATVISAVAASGAAFTSAMGRHSLGSTNALLAALNLRLGVWLPNPKVLNAGAPRPLPTPRLEYLLKEVFGRYDTDDPYVYVTDGGHWDNLGLVELLRRRCRLVVSVDASGDEPGELTTLGEIVDLAVQETGAVVDVDDAPLRDGPTGTRPGAAGNVAVGAITYHEPDCPGTDPDDCPVGVLIYAKAIVSRATPASVRAFVRLSSSFPNYPTYDQFLTEDEFDNLVALGRAAAGEAVSTLAGLEAELATGNVLTGCFEVLEPIRGRLTPPLA